MPKGHTYHRWKVITNINLINLKPHLPQLIHISPKTIYTHISNKYLLSPSLTSNRNIKKHCILYDRQIFYKRNYHTIDALISAFSIAFLSWKYGEILLKAPHFDCWPLYDRRIFYKRNYHTIDALISAFSIAFLSWKYGEILFKAPHFDCWPLYDGRIFYKRNYHTIDALISAFSIAFLSWK